MTHDVRQLTADESAISTRIRLVPPLAPDFTVYGDEATVERARRWALGHHLVLVEGVAACPHGLYGMDSCPGSCRSLGDLDHADVWYRAPRGGDEPALFILAHPYQEDVPAGSRTLADAHGLQLDTHPRDQWYSQACVPIRLTAPRCVHVWPLEVRCLVLASMLPVAWPEVTR